MACDEFNFYILYTVDLCLCFTFEFIIEPWITSSANDQIRQSCCFFVCCGWDFIKITNKKTHIELRFIIMFRYSCERTKWAAHLCGWEMKWSFDLNLMRNRVWRTNSYCNQVWLAISLKLWFVLSTVIFTRFAFINF